MATAPPQPQFYPSIPRPQMPDLSIPEALEGLPPVNSSGYVVPLSPSVTTNLPTMPQQPPITNYATGLGLDLNGANASDMGLPSWQLAQDHTQPHTTNSSPMDNTQSPFSQSSTSTSSNMIPESWQVPLTADWEFGDNPWTGLFPTESIAASAQAPNIHFPILSAESFLDMPGTEHDVNMGYNAATGGVENPYNFTAGPGTQDPNQGPYQGQSQAESTWPNGFLGLF